jgi:hypothetical protein
MASTWRFVHIFQKGSFSPFTKSGNKLLDPFLLRFKNMQVANLVCTHVFCLQIFKATTVVRLRTIWRTRNHGFLTLYAPTIGTVCRQKTTPNDVTMRFK